MSRTVFPGTSMPDPDWWRALWPEPEKVLARLDISPTAHVVDLCCGDGLFTVPLAHMARRVTAIDLDAEMVERTRARLSASGTTNCTLIAGDAYALAELVAEPADVVLIANTFHGVPDKARLARAVAATLNAGGRFIVINWHRRPREQTTVLGEPRGPKTETRMAPEEVAATVSQAGLRPLDVIDLPPYHYAAISRKRPEADPA